MDQSPAVAFSVFADAWPRAIGTEIGTTLCAIGCGKDFYFLTPLMRKLLSDTHKQSNENITFGTQPYLRSRSSCTKYQGIMRGVVT